MEADSVNKRVRLIYPDMAKGIGMILIVLGHNHPPQLFEEWLSTFHVPLFFIISGFFIKNIDPKTTFLKGWKQLLYPMLITGVICSLGLIVLFSKDGEYKGPEWMYYIKTTCLVNQFGYLGMWFLGALFTGKLVLSLIMQWTKNYLLFWALLIYIVVWLTPFDMRSQVPLYFIQNGCMSVVYLAIGYIARGKLLAEWKYNKELLLLCVIIVLLAHNPISFVKCIMPDGIFNILISASVSLAVICLCKWLVNMQRQSFRILCLVFAWYGRYSLAILSGHALLHACIMPKVQLPLPSIVLGITEVLVLGLFPFALSIIPKIRDIYFVNRTPLKNFKYS